MLEPPAPVPGLLLGPRDQGVLSTVSLILMAISLLPLFANTSLLLLFSAVGFYNTSLFPTQSLEGGLLHPASAALWFCFEGD